jgi:indole-3-glycerol phosphate synthase
MILDKIVENKHREVAERKQRTPLAKLLHALRDLQPTRDLAQALTQPGPNIIAEVKIASPSAGMLMKKHNPLDLAQLYEKSGAAAISVVVDQAFFQGNLALLSSVRAKVQLPVLCKDFIFDEYQIYEARLAGADAVLLIAAILDEDGLQKYLKKAAELNMAALVEVHNEEELKKALAVRAALIGINNRDLKTFKVSLETTTRLKSMIPAEKVVVSESGLKTRHDIQVLQKAGVQAFLIGETFITSDDPAGMMAELRGKDGVTTEVAE